MEMVGLCALMTLAMLLAMTPTVTGCARPKAVNQVHENESHTVSAAFDRTLEAAGPDYLRGELDLRQAAPLDPALNQRLRQVSAHGEPIARLLAQVVLDWGGPKRADFNAALDYLDRLPGKLARTAMGKPSPTGTESYLTLHFADRVAELLALRLIKEDAWPPWKARAVIFYVTAHRPPSTTTALIRFAIETPDTESRGLAIAGVRAIDDPTRATQVAAEIARAQRLQRPVPPDVRALAN
jgi:hypothetical protein